MAKESKIQGQKPDSKKSRNRKRRKFKLIIVIIEIVFLLGVLAFVWANGKMDKLNTDVTFRGQDVRVELPKET